MNNSRRDRLLSTHTIIYLIAAVKASALSLSVRTVLLDRIRLLRLTPRMWALMAVFSASYLLLDAVAAFVISRLVYLGFRNGFERICNCFGARLQARLASHSATPHTSLLLLGSTTWPSGAPIVPTTQWNGGGIGGTNLPDSVQAPGVLRPFVHRHIHSESSATSRVAAGSNPAPRSSLLTAAQRRDWIAVTDPQRRFEVPVYPEIESLVHVLA